jgi:hypothetical protein
MHPDPVFCVFGTEARVVQVIWLGSWAPPTAAGTRYAVHLYINISKSKYLRFRSITRPAAPDRPGGSGSQSSAAVPLLAWPGTRDGEMTLVWSSGRCRGRSRSVGRSVDGVSQQFPPLRHAAAESLVTATRDQGEASIVARFLQGGMNLICVHESGPSPPGSVR